jgi:hypothetical protein
MWNRVKNEFNVETWDTDFHYGVWNYSISSCTNWYAWKNEDAVGTMKTTLIGKGKGSLDFGNCWSTGVVKVYLDGSEIETAGPGESKVVSFDYHDGQIGNS